MLAAFWLTRSMRASEPVVGVTPTTPPARTAALSAVALVPCGCGCRTLLAFLQFHPVGDPAYGAFSPSARIAVPVGQIVVRSLGGPLLGVALGRRVRFPGAAVVLFLTSPVGGPADGPDPSASGLGARRGAAAVRAVRPLHAPQRRPGATAWRGSPWFFIGWQLALCAIAVLVALLRGAEGRLRSRIIRALGIAGAAAVIMLVLAGTGGFTHAVTT